MQKHSNINELLTGGGERLKSLRRRSQARSEVLARVCAALPPKLAEAVASAGIEHGRLTIGVVGAAWAARLRYLSDALRKTVGESLAVDIKTVRLKVVPPPSYPPQPP
jgi:hypothetical protein